MEEEKELSIPTIMMTYGYGGIKKLSIPIRPDVPGRVRVQSLLLNALGRHGWKPLALQPISS